MRLIAFDLIVALCGAFGIAEALLLQQPEGRETKVGAFKKVAEHVNSQNLLFADPQVQKLFDEERNISVIVVGANDGSIGQQSNDPMIGALSNINVRALMVEPNPPVFKTLEHNLEAFPESQRLQPLNVAICADTEGVVSFYVVGASFQSKCPDAPHWAKYELSSMDLTMISNAWNSVGCGFQKKEEFESFIEEIQVPCWTPSHLMGIDGFKPQLIDFLLVDAEGFDDKVVTAFMSHLDFEPTVIIYEHKHLAGAAASELVTLLNKRGYSTRMLDKANTLAWKQ